MPGRHHMSLAARKPRMPQRNKAFVFMALNGETFRTWKLFKNLVQLFKTHRESQGCGSVAQCLPSLHEAPDSIPTWQQNKKSNAQGIQVVKYRQSASPGLMVLTCDPSFMGH